MPLPAAAGAATMPVEGAPMHRYARIIRIRPDKLDEYKRLRAECWPQVRRMMHEQNIRNCSIYHKDGLAVLYYEYVGTDYAADQQKFHEDPTMRKWQQLTGDCQQPWSKAQRWAAMEEVFHQD